MPMEHGPHPQVSGRRPLDGIRILDVSTVIAAPLAAMLLADFGAEVIKVEHPVNGCLSQITTELGQQGALFRPAG